MAQAEQVIRNTEWPQEDARLAALAATGILDTEPEPSFDAITRLSAEYFQADSVLLGFADESRFWIKSYWGEPVRELPRYGSIFDMVLSLDGPVVVPDISRHPKFRGCGLPLRRLDLRSFASVPVRSFDGKVLGALSIFWLPAATQHGSRRVADAGEPGRYGSQPAGIAQASQQLSGPWIAAGSFGPG